MGVLLSITLGNASAIVLMTIATWAYVVWLPGYSLRGKLDRYLCLDGQWIENFSWNSMPGERFFERRQLGFAFIFILLMLLFWGPSSMVQNEPSESLPGSDQVSTSLINKQKEGELHGHSLSQQAEQLDEVRLNWNLKEGSKKGDLSEAPSSDKVHFYRETWIQRLPFEWE